MTAGIFDQLTHAFVDPINGAFGLLSRYALPLLALLGLIYLLLRLAEVVVRGGALNDLLATLIWTLVKIGVFYWIIVVFRDLALAALNTFVTWGLAPGGGQFGLPDFLQPSRIVDAGFTAAVPLQDFIVKQTGVGGREKLWPDHHVSGRLCRGDRRLRGHGPGRHGGAD